MLEIVGKDVVYCDTDSIKFVGDHDKDFEAANIRLKALAEKHGAFADNKSGKRYYLGTWDKEHDMCRFKTLGAKKYLYEQWEYHGGQWEKRIYSTIAGVNKSRGQEYFSKHGFTAFKAGTIIEESGHLVAYRNDDQIHKIVIDGCEMTTASNIALVDDTYTLGVTTTYLDLISKLVDNISYFIPKEETK